MFLRLFLFLLAITSSLRGGVADAAIHCNVLILGAGPGGVHTAYQLSKLPNQNICVVEKEDHLGGRLFDVALDPTHPQWVYGMGGLRVMESQKNVLNLAKEIGVELEYAPYKDTLINTRGIFGADSGSIAKQAYPLVQISEDDLYKKLLTSPERANAKKYPSIRSYMQSVIGAEAQTFLHDVSRFRAEFEAPIDVRSYLDYMDEEMETCCNAYYPTGGMSAFVYKMADHARSRGVRFFSSEPAISIHKAFGLYQVKTPHYVFEGQKLVIAINAQGFKYVGGDIARRIQSQRQFQDILGIKVVTVAQQFPNAWWQNTNIRRAWTNEHCLNALEIPLNTYAVQQRVMRSVYDDDMRCVSFWENTYRHFGLKGVETEIMKGLKHLFSGAHIPWPSNTVIQFWPAAWYYLRAGTPFSNREIAEWAVEPLPGEDVSLVGDSYYIQRSGWSDAAYKSSMNTLKRRFGMEN